MPEAFPDTHLRSQPFDLRPSLVLWSSTFEACTSSPVMAAMRKHTTPGNKISALLMRPSKK